MSLHAKKLELLFPLNLCPKEYPMLGVTWKCTHIYKKIITSNIITVISVTFCNATRSWCTWRLHIKGGYSSSVLHSGQTPPFRSHLVIHWRQKWPCCYVSLRQWWEFISHTCEHTANWANTLVLKPLSYALLAEGDTKLNYCAKYPSVIFHFKFHKSHVLTQLHVCSDYFIIRNCVWCMV